MNKKTMRRGEEFVLMPLAEYRRLTSDDGLPPLPAADAGGHRNAIEFMRTSIARTLIRDRRAAGLTQQQLAKLSGVRQETISRIESGKHTATVRTIDKLDRAIRRAASSSATATRKRKSA
jgi:DNA-binding XRE family transcriptional regulator